MVKSSIQQDHQTPEQKKRSHNMIHREKKNRKAVLYKPSSLLFQECCETSALDVVSQHWSFSFLAFLPPFPPSDVLCPDRLHMEAKGDTGGLIQCQRHAKAIWALNQTFRVSYMR